MGPGKRRLPFIFFAVIALAACGSVGRMSSAQPASTPDQPVVPGAPTPDPDGPKFLTVVLKAGADPAAVG